MMSQLALISALVIGARAGPFPADQNTAMGSKLLDTSLPVATIAFGFEGCDVDTLITGLRQHKDAVGGTSVTKDYFSSKMKGHCNRFAARDAQKQNASAYHTYIKSCYRGIQPGVGRTTVDVSPSYSRHAEDFIAELQRMEGHVTLRFLAVVCEPSVRALRQLKTSMQSANAQAMTYGKMSKIFAEELRKEAHGHDSELINQGNYAKIFTGFLAKFPKESLLIINSDKIHEKATWRRVYEHIGVMMPPDYKIAKGMQPVMQNTRPLSLLDPDVLKRLRRHYNAYDALLWDMMEAKFW